ncbi:unnamed protein product [Nezara viridula]|uniref:Uncharacterized protein n=1 Tax=Nezara viridula TaxID=85310 RepID=A0A9P0HL80_NEZVI|nr:unnamed protein product [Nezara viridula]
MDDAGVRNLGVTIKKEVIDETETTDMSNMCVSIKEEVTDEYDLTDISSLGVSIKEERTDENVQQYLSFGKFS